MPIINRYVILGLGLSFFLAASLFVAFRETNANAALFATCTVGNTASTTVVFMQPGKATTTLTLPAFPSSPPGCGGVPGQAFDSAFVQLQYNATTTGAAKDSVILYRVEHSRDGIDWYAESNVLTSNATSTPVTGDSAFYRLNFSTSTDNGGTGDATHMFRSFGVNTPTQYTRVIFINPANQSASDANFWAEIIGKRQNN